jgi:phosphatidylserine decarboxylase
MNPTRNREQSRMNLKRDHGSGAKAPETEFGSGALRFLYTTVGGRLLLRLVVSKPVSKLYAAYNNSKRSAAKIARFVADNHIDVSEFADNEFNSFNAFFMRRLKAEARPLDQAATSLIAVADAKLLAFELDADATIAVKQTVFSAGALLDDDKRAQAYCEGSCLVFRLTVDDCHRFAYVDAGTLIESREIAGKLHSVQPIAQQKYRVFHENKRHVSVLATENLGEIVQVEVGALLVGGIRNHELQSFARGQEKGYFELGGSTIIVLLKPGVVRIDPEIETRSQQGIETKVKLGQRIGVVETKVKPGQRIGAIETHA